MSLFVAAMAVLWPGVAPAGPCDSAPGARFRQVAALGEWERGQIARLTPEGPARLYLGACGMGCVEGIAHPRAEWDVAIWDVAIESGGNGIVFMLSGGGSERGTLTFPWPESYEWFGADTSLGGGRAALHTEMRFEGAIAGRGDFAHDGPLPAELVLTGAGSACITARGFTGWTLSVEGAGASYRLFGRLRER